jgi:uncharacterized protein with FMN-binding domain
MNKYAVSIIVIVTFFFYSLQFRSENNEAIQRVTAMSPDNSNKPSRSTASKPNTSLYKDGTYKGDVVDAIYGNVATEVVIQNGMITAIGFPQYPNLYPYSRHINPEALPELASEAIRVQHAEVDIHTGATQTSRAFKKSLKSALDKAQK